MSIKEDAIDALVALGHKRAEAKRLVNEAIASGTDAGDVQAIIRAAYAKPPASRSPYAAQYAEYYRGSANFDGEHSELHQVARAVGPGLSEREFEALAKQVEEVQAQRDELTNKAYQAALWAIPDAFNASRKTPLHFQPQREKGKPVESELPPLPPPQAVEGLAAVETPAPVPTDALGSLNKPAVPQAATAQEMGAMVRGAGSGAVDAMYDGLWQKVQAGEVREGGQQSALLQAAKMVREGGGMQSIDAFRAMAQEYGGIERGPDFQQQMRQLVERHVAVSQVTQSPTVNVSQAISGLVNQSLPEESKTDAGGSSLDKAQAIADAVGVVDQSGVTDLANAGVSLTRAFTEPDRAGEHLLNAGMRAISAIPIVGDVAKLAKYGSKSAEAARSGRVAHHLVRSGAEAEAKAGGKSLLGGAVDAAAQAALQLVGGGSGGGDGGNSNPPTSGGAGDAADPQKIGEDSKQAAKDIKTLGDSIEKFLNGLGAAGVTLAAVGHEVYQKALKPVIDWFKAVDQTSKAMLEDNRRLADYSGGLAVAFQNLEVDRFLRDVTKAQEMTGSLSRLADAQSRREQAQQDFAMPYQKVGVELQAIRTEIVGYIIKMIDSVDFVGGLLDWWVGDQRMKDAVRNDAERAEQMLDEHLTERKLKR